MIARRHMRISPKAFDPLRPVPPIVEQTQWDAGIFRFPNRYKVQYFNPAVVDWLGRRYLVARRRRTTYNPGKNDIVLWWVDGGMRPLQEHPILFPVHHPAEHWEDPRASIINDSFWLSWSQFRAPWQMHYVHQGAGVVNNRRQVTYVSHVVYGGNGPHPLANTSNEKNWCWFMQDNAMHFVYSPAPHVVVKVGANDAVAGQYESKGIAWRYGRPRGGTNPILKDGLYWSFFHSSIDINPDPPRRRYYMGAYAFQSTPPFAPVLFTRKPLLTGSENDERELSAPLCVFPCGALLENDQWMVTFGVNDCNSGWIRIPHEDLLSKVEKA